MKAGPRVLGELRFSPSKGKARPKRGTKVWTDTPDLLVAAGFSLATIAPSAWPLNPFANMHNAFRGLDPLRALRVLLCERHADLVCAHLESAAVILFLRRLFFFRPRILIWEVPWSPGWRFRERLSAFAVPRADYCVVFSSSQRALVHATYGNRLNVAFVPFCVDTEFYKPDSTVPPAREFVWSCGLDEGRDFSTLLEASRGIDAAFRIRARPDALPAVLDHPNVVREERFLQSEEFRERYARSSVVVVCTKETPNASGVTSLLEAMSMGRPTIVTDNHALRDYFPPRDAAIVVPVGDVDALRRAILKLLADPEEAERMGRRAREFAEANFSRAQHYRHMAQAFDSAIAAVAPSPTGA